MNSFLTGVSKFVSEYMGEALVKGLGILSMDSLLRRVSRFVNGYMGEALVKDVASLMNGFFIRERFLNASMDTWVRL